MTSGTPPRLPPLRLVVVRHGRTAPDPDRPAATWPLADDALPADFAASVPTCRTWATSPEPKAVGTAALLAVAPVTVDERLREVRRGGWRDDYEDVVAAHLSDPDQVAAPGWESGTSVRSRLHDWLCDLPDDPGGPVGVVGHGLATTHLHALLTGTDPDVDWWRDLEMPDIRTWELPQRRCARLLVVAPGPRLLLLRYADEHGDPFWATPGGELVGDESYAAAASRELVEETGFDAPVGATVRTRVAVYPVARAVAARWHERYLVVDVPEVATPSDAARTDEELATIVDHRWWTPSALASTTETLRPAWLRSVLTVAGR